MTLQSSIIKKGMKQTFKKRGGQGLKEKMLVFLECLQEILNHKCLTCRLCRPGSSGTPPSGRCGHPPDPAGWRAQPDSGETDKREEGNDRDRDGKLHCEEDVTDKQQTRLSTHPFTDNTDQSTSYCKI